MKTEEEIKAKLKNYMGYSAENCSNPNVILNWNNNDCIETLQWVLEDSKEKLQEEKPTICASDIKRVCDRCGCELKPICPACGTGLFGNNLICGVGIIPKNHCFTYWRNK